MPAPGTFAPAMMAGAVLLLAAVPARAQDAHGAITFGQIAQDPAVAYGFAWDYPSRDEAQEAAMNACLESGGSGCTVLVWFQNICGALAMDQYGMVAQGKAARTQEQAEARALRTCEAAEGVGCAVVGSQCVSAGGQPETWSGSESVLPAPEEAGPTADAPQDEELTHEERLQVQEGLAALGFDAGPADGMFGPRTRSAIWDWQQAKGLEATGYLSRDEAEVLAAAGAREQPAARETAEPDGSRNEVIYFAAAGPKCAELGSVLGERDAACWQELRRQPGCYIWNEHYHSDRTADWTGGCSGDTAHGRGSYSLSSGSGHDEWTGVGFVMHGKQNGNWVNRWDGNVAEGPYVDGKLHGHWVNHFANGNVFEGPWVDGKQNGHWVLRYASGTVAEGPYVDGKRNGHWVVRYAEYGFVEEGPYVDGKRNGLWVTRWADGDVWEGPYVDGKQNGHWVLRSADGTVEEGPYVDGKRNGHWVERDADGDVREGPYVDGKRNGHWVIRFGSGSVLESEWRNDSREGQSGVYQTADGSRYPGKWSDGCFRDSKGNTWVWAGGKTKEECETQEGTWLGGP